MDRSSGCTTWPSLTCLRRHAKSIAERARSRLQACYRATKGGNLSRLTSAETRVTLCKRLRNWAAVARVSGNNQTRSRHVDGTAMPPTFKAVDSSSVDGRSESDPQELSTNMSGTALLHVDGITKSFGRVKALDNVSARFYAGEVHALLGENGAGKSTLVKIIAGVLPADAGTVGTPAGSGASDVAKVYQELSVVPALAVRDNPAISLRRSRSPLV